MIRYQINAYYEGILVSQSPILTYDAANPGLIEPTSDLSVLADGTFGFGVGIEPSVDIDSGTGDTRTLNYSNVNLRANRSQGALAIHYHNASGARADAVLTDLPEITSFAPASGAEGTPVTITGVNLDTVTNVQFFNGVNATDFTASNDGTTLTATVPVGARTGVIRLTSPAGAATSRTKFVVTLPSA